MIIIDDIDLIALGSPKQGPGSIAYQRWKMQSGDIAPPQAALRAYRRDHRRVGRGPLVIEVLDPRSRNSIPRGADHWDQVTLTVDLLWAGTWCGVPAAEQPGLVVLRPDGGVILSGSPAAFRPALPSFLAFPLVSTHDIARGCEEMRIPVPRAKIRSDMLTLLEKQGLLLPAPEPLVALHSEITRPDLGRNPGRQASVYLSLPAYALATASAGTRDRWEKDPYGAIGVAMSAWKDQIRRAEKVSAKLKQQGLWAEPRSGV